ncbi:hypothetical protein P175DRAFT_0501312 [Aspergillus ochraceoroseus IBT 24754]|uniref:Uncharacterized protein n=1 Tax=Aspergillus ochraceoroseus IBT 24754 TaxID=1392256 RepID=A0A2T5LWN4_9EURO|nr:uncharacterized protein P175DRAFT_0501312 [Aspergillus ochraceoroseus IBT 24754]PTU20690.1 hypothetical protein P175DRAFT_0501312 [Aspergillus ochraceoroseus IBT 24754]
MTPPRTSYTPTTTSCSSLPHHQSNHQRRNVNPNPNPNPKSKVKQWLSRSLPRRHSSTSTATSTSTSTASSPPPKNPNPAFSLTPKSKHPQSPRNQPIRIPTPSPTPSVSASTSASLFASASPPASTKDNDPEPTKAQAQEPGSYPEERNQNDDEDAERQFHLPPEFQLPVLEPERQIQVHMETGTERETEKPHHEGGMFLCDSGAANVSRGQFTSGVLAEECGSVMVPVPVPVQTQTQSDRLRVMAAAAEQPIGDALDSCGRAAMVTRGGDKDEDEDEDIAFLPVGAYGYTPASWSLSKSPTPPERGAAPSRYQAMPREQTRQEEKKTDRQRARMWAMLVRASWLPCRRRKYSP